MDNLIEISYMNGDGVAEEEYSRISTSDPLPVPGVGDCIYIGSGGGHDCTQGQILEVTERLFTYIPEQGSSDPAVHVQLFCQNAPKGSVCVSL